MDTLASFIPMDRRQALAAGTDLPTATTGSALFADISGFTPLTEALTRALGPQRGAEELTTILNRVYAALIAAVHQYHGSVIGFSGDAITCWFDGDAGPRGVAAGLAMQTAMHDFRALARPDGGTLALQLKTVLTAGPARRFVVGDPARGLRDVLAGATLDRLAALEHEAEPGDLLLDAATADGIAEAQPPVGEGLQIAEWRTGEAGETDRYAVITNNSSDNPQSAILPLRGAAPPQLPDPWPDHAPLAPAVARAWVLPAVAERLGGGGGRFLTELRPALALFVRFGGLDYEQDPGAPAKLDSYIRWVQEILVATGGSLIQLTLGDKGSYLYAAYGAPVAYGDDAARAAQAALALRRPPPVETGIGPGQVGLAQGIMRVGTYGSPASQTYGVLGDAANLAARLMQEAEPGQVLADRHVHQATAARFRWSSGERHTLKGKAAPVVVYTLRGERAARTQGLLEPVYTTPLIGRAAERATIATRLAAARAGQGGVLGVQGEAGLGKSRLVAAALDEARAAGWQILAGAAEATGQQTAYLAWRPLLAGLLGLSPVRSLSAQVEAIEARLMAADPGLPARLPLLGDVFGERLPDTPLTSGMAAALRKESLEALVVALVRAAAQTAPLLLVLEDAHWLDAPGGDLALTVGRALYQHPAVLLLAYRPPDPDQAALSAIRRLPDLTELALTGLPLEDTGALIAARWGHAPAGIAPALVTVLAERAGGNPFYLEELVSYLQEQGVDPADGSAVARLAWPSSLQSVLLARIDRLTERQRTTLKIASIIGRRFRMPELWGAYPDLGEPEPVSHDLAELERRDLAPLDSPPPDPTYLFKHLVTQEVAYGSVPHSLRQELHGQLAAWLEQHPDGDTVPLDRLAYHWSRSANSAKAREYLRRAGDAAAVGYNNAAAVNYYSDLLSRLPADDPERGTVLLARAEVQERTGAWDAAVADYTAAQEAPGAAAALQAAAALGCGRVRTRQGAYAEAHEWVARARAEYAALGAEAEELRAQAEVGQVHWLEGMFAEAREVLAAVVERAGAWPAIRAQVLYSLGNVARNQGDYALAQGALRESLDLRRAAGDRQGVADSLASLGVVAWNMGDYNGARSLSLEATGLQRELGNRSGITASLGTLGNVALSQGDYATARAIFTENVAYKRELGDRQAASNLLINLGNVAFSQGNPAEARALYAESMALKQELGIRDSISYILCCLGVVSYSERAYADARNYFLESQEYAYEFEQQAILAYNYTYLALTAWREGDLGEARDNLLIALPIAVTLGPGEEARNALVVAAPLLPSPLAAQALGAVTTLLDSQGAALEPIIKPLYDETIAAAQAALGPDDYAAAFAAGQEAAWGVTATEVRTALAQVKVPARL